ncbi:hypothetical protein EMMF5_001008 [Cystobasidiomycetes sp. EMM_F5]
MTKFFSVTARPWQNTHLLKPKVEPPPDPPKTDPPAPVVVTYSFYIRGPYIRSPTFSEFSPYSAHPVNLAGVRYATAAHLYWCIRLSTHAAVVQDLQSHAGFPPEQTIPRLLAIAATFKLPLNSDVVWKWRRDGIMHGIMALKFAQHSDLRKLLLSTEEVPLVYEQIPPAAQGSSVLGLLVGSSPTASLLPAVYEYADLEEDIYWGANPNDPSDTTGNAL